MERNARTKKLKIAIIAIALLLCLALAIGITTAFYQAQRRAMGSVKMDQGIIIDYKGFNKGDENIWQRETTTTFKLFEERDAQPGEQIYAYPAGIRANAESVDFYARLKLEYSFYNVVGGVETSVALANPKSLIKTSSTFFDSNWVESTDGYYYYGAGTVLNKFSKDATNYIDIFAKDGEGNVVAQFLIEGANFVGETAGEGGGFVVEDTYINKIVVLLTLETLQGDATAEQAKDLGWGITTLNEQIVDITNIPDEKPEINIDDIISDDKKDGEITITGDPAQPLTITIGSKAFYGCSKLKLTLSNSENIEYRIATDAFSTGASIMYGIDNVSRKLINPSTTGHTTVGFDGKWQVSAPGLYLFLPSPITSTSSEYGDFQYTDDQGTWYFDLIDESGNKVDASTLSSTISRNGASTFAASTYATTDNYTAKLNKFEPKAGVTTVVIPKYLGVSEDSNKFAVTMIVSGALSRNHNLISITIPNSVIGMSSTAFNECNKLISIIVSDGNTVYHSKGNCLIETANKTLIAGCKNSEIPTDGSVTSIGDYAFSGCSGLTSITIPDSVTSIGWYAFDGCYSLSSVIIGNGLTSIERGAFGACIGLTSITIPDSVISIENDAFGGCRLITSINIGAGVSEVSWLPSNGSSMTIRISENNPYLATDSKAIFAKSNGELSLSKYISADTTYEIPAEINGFLVTSIGDYCFYECNEITSVTIPSSVIRIGRSAFENYNFTSITIPDSVTSVGDRAFYGCDAITSVPAGIKNIGTEAFYACKGLTSIVLPEGIQEIPIMSFGACDNLTSLTIPASVTSIGKHAFIYCNDLNIYINNIEAWCKINNSSYQDGMGLPLYNLYLSNDLVTNLVIPNDVDNIGIGVFSRCKSLTSIVLPEGIKEIPSSCFNGCSNLKTVTIPSTCTTIGEYAFSDCYNLTSITIPDSVTSIGSSAFSSCSSLTSIVLPEGIKEIPSFCFNMCFNLKTVTIPSTCTTIGDSAFQDCTNLTTVIWNISYDLGGVNATGPELSSYTGSQTSGLTMEDIIKSAPTNVESGFIFEGWSDGVNIYQPGENIIFSLTNRRLTAVWSLGYIISFDRNGGDGEAIASVKGYKGDTVSITFPDLTGTREGYKFIGWSLDQNATSATYKTETISITLQDSKTYYAVWGAPTTILFDANGGTGSVPADLKLFGGDSFTIPSASLTREGYKFLGWSWSSTATSANLTAGNAYIYDASNGTTLYAVWGAPTTITFNANGGTGSVPADIKVFDGDNFTIPSASLTREGYKFLGWSWSSTATYASLTAGTNYTYYSSNGTTLYAVWKEPTTINFDLDGGEGELPSPLTTYYGDTLTINTGKNFTKEGYKFAGWILIDERGNQQTTYGYNTTTTFYYNGSSYTLKAKWSEPQTITFYNDNTKSQSFTMTGFFEADGITMPEGTELTNAGYMLVGWNTSANASYVGYNIGSYYSNFTTIELYAVWKLESECTKYVFDLSEVDGQANIVRVGYSGSFQISSIEILSTLRNASGQLISGWTETQGSSNQDYSMTSWLDYDWNHGQTKTLYPIWVTPITLTFNANGGEGDVPSPIETYYQGQFSIPAVSLTKEGYVFAGWAWESNATYTVYENGSTNNSYYESDGRSTLYAVWAVPRTLTFDSNGGQGDVPASIQTYYEGRFDIPSVTLTKEGYTFLGWSFTKNLTSTYGGGDMFEKEQTDCGYRYNADKTLYAVWGKTVTIKFDMNDGTGTSLGTVTVSFGESFNFPTNPSRTGYKFLGWDYRQNAEYPNWGTSTTRTNSRFISGNVTIYAQWEVLNNQVYVGSLTSSELAAIQEVWSGKSSLSQISDRTLIQSMYDNNIHSRFRINAYLNETKLSSETSSHWDYGFGDNTQYFKLSTNEYVFEFENALPTGWKLVNYRYEVKAQGDVTIVDGKAQATIDYTYVDLSSADQSDNLMILFVLPSMPAESESVAVSVGALPGNVIGNSDLEGGFLGLTGFKVEIYDASTDAMLWLGTLKNSAIEYRFATGTYKVRVYTTNVVGVGVYNTDGAVVEGLASAVTYGDGYSEVTINYTFAEGNPDLKVYFLMHDFSMEGEMYEIMTMAMFNGPYNLQGNFFKAMLQLEMGVGDLTDDEMNRAFYNYMLIQEYIGSSLKLTPDFTLYSSEGYELRVFDGNISLESESEGMIFIGNPQTTYTIKFTSEVVEMLVVNMETFGIEGDLTPTYNAETGTWDVTFTPCEGASVLIFYTPDIDLSAYEGLPEYDPNTDYSSYFG